MLLPILLLAAGCGDTWDKFMTPDFAWSRDRALSADRSASGTPAFREAVRASGGASMPHRVKGLLSPVGKLTKTPCRNS